MDVERTMEFILECQARAEVRMAKADARMEKVDDRMAKAEARMAKVDDRMAKAEARMERADARMEKADARMEKVDKRLAGISKLINQGMRMLAKTDTTLAELAQAQKATERNLNAFIASLRKGKNGRNGS